MPASDASASTNTFQPSNGLPMVHRYTCKRLTKMPYEHTPLAHNRHTGYLHRFSIHFFHTMLLIFLYPLQLNRIDPFTSDTVHLTCHSFSLRLHTSFPRSMNTGISLTTFQAVALGVSTYSYLHLSLAILNQYHLLPFLVDLDDNSSVKETG
jgi:hypothetical protein